MGTGGVPRVALLPRYLELPHLLPDLHRETARFEVGIEGLTTVAEVENHMIALGILQGDPRRGLRNLIGIAIDAGPDRGVGDSEDPLPVLRIARILQPIADIQAVIRRKSVEVDREALRKVKLAIERLQRPAMGPSQQLPTVTRPTPAKGGPSTTGGRRSTSASPPSWTIVAGTGNPDGSVKVS